MNPLPAAGVNGARRDTHILAVDDDPVTCRLLEFLLGSQGYDVTTLTDPREALQRIQEQPADLLLLDVQLPRVDGLTLMRQLKREHPDLPVVMLTARADMHDRVAGLEGGADDYIVKPFEPAELLARIKAVLRRSGRVLSAPAHSILTENGLQLDMLNLSVSIRGVSVVQLTPVEARLLRSLIAHPNTAISREDLAAQIVGNGADTTGNRVDVHIGNIRRKLGDDPERPRYIQTVRGHGYKFLVSAD